MNCGGSKEAPDHQGLPHFAPGSIFGHPWGLGGLFGGDLLPTCEGAVGIGTKGPTIGNSTQAWVSGPGALFSTPTLLTC